jgi:hypothetical protein
MKSGFPNAHANHDESLVVRLYGDDLGATERSRALELVAGCEECAALFADMGQIAAATAALPTPARPRDFSLTPEDAARLRPQRQRRFQWRGLSRSLGGAFAALGLAGIVLAGASTLLAPAASLNSLSLSAAPQDQAAFQSGAVAAGGEAQSDQPNAAAASAEAGSITSNPGGAKAVAGTSGPSAAPSLAPLPADSASLAMRVPSSTPSAAEGFGAQPLSPTPPASNESVDARPVVLIGSAALLLAGLLLLAWPRLRRRRVRG